MLFDLVGGNTALFWLAGVPLTALLRDFRRAFAEED